MNKEHTPGQTQTPYKVLFIVTLLSLIGVSITAYFSNKHFNEEKDNIWMQALIDWTTNDDLSKKSKQDACLIFEELIQNTDYYKNNTVAAEKILSTACEHSYQDSTVLMESNVIVGLVLDSATKRPIGDATVSFGDKLVYTDGRGLFGFSVQRNKTANKYIWTRKSGYESDRKSVENLNAINRMNIYLTEN